MYSVSWADKGVDSLVGSQRSWFGIIRNLLRFRFLRFSSHWTVFFCLCCLYCIYCPTTLSIYLLHICIHYICCLSPAQRGHGATALLWQLQCWHQIVAIVPLSPLDPTYYFIDTDFHPLSTVENRPYCNLNRFLFLPACLRPQWDRLQ